MKITRRFVAFALLISSLVSLALAGGAQKTATNHTYLDFVGTYTAKTNSKGIYAFEFDTQSGKLTPRGVAAETKDPSWVVIHPSGKCVYAANEAGKQSAVTAFAVDPR